MPIAHVNICYVRSEKLENESSPNSSNFRPEFCSEFCSEFSPEFHWGRGSGGVKSTGVSQSVAGDKQGRIPMCSLPNF